MKCKVAFENSRATESTKATKTDSKSSIDRLNVCIDIVDGMFTVRKQFGGMAHSYRRRRAHDSALWSAMCDLLTANVNQIQTNISMCVC